MKRVLLFAILVGVQSLSLAETIIPVDTVKLIPVSIMAERINIYAPVSPVFEIDETQIERVKYQNLSQLLTEQSPVHIRSYGFGGSATLSIRGLEPRHTQVSWNGFNLNSSSLGMCDLSIVPLQSFSDLVLIGGSRSTMSGNSSIGGLLMLTNDIPKFDNSISVDLFGVAASFSTYNTGIKLNLSSNNLESTTKLFYGESKNDFTYTNTAQIDQPEVKQQNAEFQEIGIMQDFAVKINNHHTIFAGMWYQVSKRQIPPLMTTPNSLARQKDSLLRTYIKYQWLLEKTIIKIGGAWFSENQLYTDELYELSARYDVNNVFADGDITHHINQYLVYNGGYSFNKASAAFNEYDGKQQRTIHSLYSGISFQPSSRLNTGISVRKEFTNIEDPPLIFHLEAEYFFIDSTLSVFASGGNHFNLPTLNDLYWVPGGNPNLLSENGYCVDVGVKFKSKNNKFKSSVSYYNMQINDWIKWYPLSAGFYSPDNIKKVSSEGIEVSINHNFKKGVTIFKFYGWYTYCTVRTLESIEPYAQSSIGKQLIYVPEHKGGFTFEVAVKGFLFGYSHSMNGHQYTRIDNSQWLDGYQIGNLKIQKALKINNTQLNLFADINNIFDTTYQTIAWRPMPGRWYRAGFNLNLSKQL